MEPNFDTFPQMPDSVRRSFITTMKNEQRWITKTKGFKLVKRNILSKPDHTVADRFVRSANDALIEKTTMQMSIIGRLLRFESERSTRPTDFGYSREAPADFEFTTWFEAYLGLKMSVTFVWTDEIYNKITSAWPRDADVRMEKMNLPFDHMWWCWEGPKHIHTSTGETGYVDSLLIRTSPVDGHVRLLALGEVREPWRPLMRIMDLKVGEKVYKPGSKAEEIGFDALTLAGVAFLNSPYSKVERAQETKPRVLRKRKRKRKREQSSIDVNDEVYFITLRQDSAPGTPTGRSHTYAHRFRVRGHLRNQPYGPGKSKRKLIWVDDFEKGPEDAPLKPAMYKVVR